MDGGMRLGGIVPPIIPGPMPGGGCIGMAGPAVGGLVDRFRLVAISDSLDKRKARQSGP